MVDDERRSHSTQDEVFAAPTFFVDGNLGIATAGGVARVTFAAFKLNVTPGASHPKLQPVMTVAVAEKNLLQFAHEIIERAAQVGITLDDNV